MQVHSFGLHAVKARIVTYANKIIEAYPMLIPPIDMNIHWCKRYTNVYEIVIGEPSETTRIVHRKNEECMYLLIKLKLPLGIQGVKYVI